jgi:hypothetical protein
LPIFEGIDVSPAPPTPLVPDYTGNSLRKTPALTTQLTGSALAGLYKTAPLTTQLTGNSLASTMTPQHRNPAESFGQTPTVQDPFTVTQQEKDRFASFFESCKPVNGLLSGM